MTSHEYLNLARTLYQLILTEINQATTKDDIAPIYPQLVVMYEFFRLLRGESFHSSKPPMGNLQSELYQLEDELNAKLQQLKSNLDFTDSRLQYHLELAQTLFR